MREKQDVCPPPPAWRGRVEWAFLAVLLLFALFLRLPGMGRPAWIDEVITLGWAEKTYTAIFSQNITPFMPATARTMFVLFRSGAMDDELLVRIPHLVFGMAGILAVFLFLRSRHGFVAASMAALFLATLPQHVVYSQEARYYSLNMLAETFLLFSLLATVRRMSLRTAGLLFVSVFLGMLNHLTFLFPLAALTAAGCAVPILRSAPPKRRILHSTAILLVVLSGMVAALTPSLLLSEDGRYQKVLNLVHGFGGMADEEETYEDLSGPAVSAAGEPTHRLEPGVYWSKYLGLHFLGVETPLAFCASLLLVIGGMGFLLVRDRVLGGMLAALLLVHAPFFFLRVGHEWCYRYFVVQIVALALLTGCCGAGVLCLLERARGTGTRAAAMTVLALYGVFVCTSRANAYENRHRPFPDLGQKAVARALSHCIEAGDLVVVVGDKAGWRPRHILKYYLHRELSDYTDVWPGISWKTCRDIGELRQALHGHQQGNRWVITKRQDGYYGDVIGMCRYPAILWQSSGPAHVWLSEPPPHLDTLRSGTESLLEGGDFEGNSRQLTLPPEGVVVSGGEAYDGNGTLKISVPPGRAPKERPMPTVWFRPALPSPESEGVDFFQDKRILHISFMLKCENVSQGENAAQVVRVMARGVNSTAESFFLDYLRIEGTRAWQRYDVYLELGVSLPEDAEDVQVGIGNRGGSGTFWLDDVRIERRPRVSPLTRNVGDRLSGQAGVPQIR